MPSSVTFHRFDLDYRDLRAELTGATDSSERFLGELVVATEDLATLPETWGWPDLQGHAGMS